MRRRFARLERRKVLLHTRDGRSFQGVLAHVYHDCVCLAHVTTWTGPDPVVLGGEVVVGCENISFFQSALPEDPSDDARDR